jgi:hypothetical protein
MLRATVAAVVSTVSFVTLSACAAWVPAVPAAQSCWTELNARSSQTPEGPRVRVASNPTCSLRLPEDATWMVRVSPADWSRTLAEVEVAPDIDGAFSVDVALPPDSPSGPAVATLDGYYEYVPCDDTGEGSIDDTGEGSIWGMSALPQAACATPSVEFTIVR